MPLGVWADSSTPSNTSSGADSSASSSQASAPVTDPTAPTTKSSSTPPGPNAPTNPLTGASNTGPKVPNGADASTFTFNPATGIWENAYYTWDPATNQTTPKTPSTYSYNPATGMWDTTQWIYDAPSGKYVPNVKSVAKVPQGSQGNSINNTGPNSLNNIDQKNTNNAFFNSFYNAAISNTLSQTATSGNASILGNTLAGGAQSGNAMDVSNIINLLQSTWNIQPATDLMTFTANINGNVTGDLMLDPSKISNTGPLSVNTINAQADNNLTINSQGSGLIDNNVTLGATSGSAVVSGNTNGGNATSGNADAVANIVNVINSAIGAGKSFLGVININGNLNGDILLPPNFLDQLITSSAPRSTVNLSQTQNNNLTANLTSNQAINNTVDLSAASGKASVSGNTSAGNATTGNANTNLTIFNLTGRQVVAANSLMVFVNVLGQWVGLIVDAPAGSNSAAFCGGTCQISSTTNNNATINDTSNNTINNNLKIKSLSGDATVSKNTSGGNATSGNASASANLMNINNSQLSLSGWFGLLFINVLGNWHGSFGINTDAGTIAATNPTSGASNSPTPAKVFTFTPEGGSNSTDLNSLFSVLNDQNGASASGDQSSNPSATAAATRSNNKPPKHHGASASKGEGANWVIPVVTSAVAFAIFSLVGIFEYGDKVRLWFLSQKLNKKPQPKAWMRFTLF